MADIKTKNTNKDIKVFDKAATVGDKIKDTYIRTKNNTENLTEDGHNSPTEYAESNIRSAVEGETMDTARGVKNTTESAYKKGRELYLDMFQRADDDGEPDVNARYVVGQRNGLTVVEVIR